MALDGSFEELMKRRRQAASAYVNGDSGPLGELIARSSPSTFFGPSSGYVQNADEVWQTHQAGARAFAPGSETELEVLHQAASGELGYWVGIQRAVVRMQGKPELVRIALRVSELFRRGAGGWELVHRHADLLAEPPARAESTRGAAAAGGGDGGTAIRANESAATNAGPPFDRPA